MLRRGKNACAATNPRDLPSADGRGQHADARALLNISSEAEISFLGGFGLSSMTRTRASIGAGGRASYPTCRIKGVPFIILNVAEEIGGITSRKELQ
jgi:hypothetical protein